MKKFLTVAVVLCLVTACGKRAEKTASAPVEKEDREAKALLQGIWVDMETEEVVFKAVGDTICYPDSTSQPAYFRIVSDSLELSGRRYAIERQSANLFWFKNPNGDIIKLSKSDDPLYKEVFVQQTPRVLNYTEVVNRDSVIMSDGERYHWYVTINPTKYKVVATSYNDDGVGVDNVYYDNIIHLSLFQGARRLYSSDFRKQMYVKLVPASFLNEAILSNIEYSHADANGFHFSATLCKPDGVSCYMVDIVIAKDGKMNMKLLEH
jgi:hypothetical protein